MFAGIAWALLGGLFLGTFALPSKYIKNYAWENTWGSFFLFAMLVVPVGFACLIVNNLWATFGEVSPGIIFGVVALSFLWGCGFCCWGRGLAMVGLSLGYALTMGTMALVGSMLPFFLGSAEKLPTPGGITVVVGILVCILGVAVNGYAGMQREKSEAGGGEEAEPETEPAPFVDGYAETRVERPAPKGEKKTMLAGLLVCVLAGVLSSGLNVAFHVGGQAEWVGGEAEIEKIKAQKIAEIEKAEGMGAAAKAKKIEKVKNEEYKGINTICQHKFGNAPWKAGLSTWALVFMGGLISSFGFSCILLFKNKTWSGFGVPESCMNLGMTFLMAVAHFLCIFFYGLGAIALGNLGTSVGFAIFQSSAVILGSSLGFFTGEWKGASGRSKGWLVVGITILVLGIVVVSYGKAIM